MVFFVWGVFRGWDGMGWDGYEKCVSERGGGEGGEFGFRVRPSRAEWSGVQCNERLIWMGKSSAWLLVSLLLGAEGKIFVD